MSRQQRRGQQIRRLCAFDAPPSVVSLTFALCLCMCVCADSFGPSRAWMSALPVRRSGSGAGAASATSGSKRRQAETDQTDTHNDQQTDSRNGDEAEEEKQAAGANKRARTSTSCSSAAAAAARASSSPSSRPGSELVSDFRVAGGTYTGSLVSGVPEGHGTLQTRREQYTGEFVAGKRDGIGVSYDTCARLTYEGQFEANMRSGLGVQWDAKGALMACGRWANDKLKDATAVPLRYIPEGKCLSDAGQPTDADARPRSSTVAIRD